MAGHIPDILADRDYTWHKSQQIGGFRTTLSVPLLREGIVIGVMALTRGARVQPFTAKQGELVTTFADQAVIAIENVRLFDEVQARTQELARSVEELRALGAGGQFDPRVAKIIIECVERGMRDPADIRDCALQAIRGVPSKPG
jgi:GAF domain-containing protein